MTLPYRCCFTFGLTLLAALAPASAEVAVGDTAPDFTLPATDGTEVTLSEVIKEKNVVLAFFPKAFTGG